MLASSPKYSWSSLYPPSPIPTDSTLADELDRPNPLDHLEAELILDPEPEWRAVLLVQRLEVHLVGQEALGMPEGLERVAVVVVPAFEPLAE